MPAKQLRNKLYLTGITFILLITACENINDKAKYQKPDWLAGKLYTQISQLESLSTFKRCLELAGYDTILDRTGSFTLFAPDNQAFTEYLGRHSEYGGSVENIPFEDLRNLVKLHIIQDAWTLNQLQRLDVGGWIDPEDPNNNKPRAYKRQTLLKDPNTKFWIKNDKGNITIVDSSAANGYRIVYSRSRKYVPIFFSEYLSLNNLTGSDYEFYYNRPFENGNIYYANAKILGNEVFAENGFIFEVDQVVDQAMNVEQLLNSDYHGATYRYMKEIFRMFPEFKADLDVTNKQPEAKAGLNFDTLYILNYPKFPFNLQDELTGPNTNDDRYTLRYQNGILAPDDDAFKSFIDNVITGPTRWSSWSAVPLEIKRIVVNNLMTGSPIYQSDIQKGFLTGEGDVLHIDESIIDIRYYASNATFLGINKVVLPRALTSVSAPVYLRPGFSYFLYAMEKSKVLPAIKKAETDYSFFIIPDNTLEADSSLLLTWVSKDKNLYDLGAFDRSEEKFKKMDVKTLSKRLLNQVGINNPTGMARKEFIENLAGNYIIYDNDNNSVRGGAFPTAGYNGGDIITIFANKINEPTDNGTTYEVNGWIVPSNNSMYNALSSHLWFLNLLEKAGMYNSKTYKFNFLTEGETYTVFIPSQQALTDYGADTLSASDLEKLLRYHFVKGEKIFTDGRVPSGNFGTLRIDESSTPIFTRFTPMKIQTGADYLEIFDQSTNLLGRVDEEENKNNIMITTDTDLVSTSVFDNITTAVLHEIDFVIHK